MPKLHSDLNTLLTCFSPISKHKRLLMPQDDTEIDVLIATDCVILKIREEFIMIPIIVIVILAVVVILWFVSTQRSLVVLDENINNAMSQIGVQLSSRWDALTALLDLTKGYAEHEYKTLSDVTKLRTSITGRSSAADAQKQDNIITKTMGKIMAVAESYPDLKANENYVKTMDSVNQYENMVRSSRLVYNDSVTKLNRAVRMFPTSIIAGMLGFSQRDYLQEDVSKSSMPSMK